MATSSIDKDIFLRDFNELRNTNDLLSYRLLHKYLTDATAIDPALETRLQTLENNEIKVTYYESVNTATGTVTLPTGATILLDQFEGADALLAQISGGVVQGIMPVNSAGAYVDIATFSGAGAWTFTGTPAAYPVAVIYMIKIKFKDYVNLNINNILEETDNNEVTTNTSQTITGLKTIKPSSTTTNALHIQTLASQANDTNLIKIMDSAGVTKLALKLDNNTTAGWAIQVLAGYLYAKGNGNGYPSMFLDANGSEDIAHFRASDSSTILSKIDSLGNYIAPDDEDNVDWIGNFAVPTKSSVVDRLGVQNIFRVTESGGALTVTTHVFDGTHYVGPGFTWTYDGTGQYRLESDIAIWDTTKTTVKFGATNNAVIGGGYFCKNHYAVTSSQRIDFVAFDMISASMVDGMWIDQIVEITTYVN